MRNTIQILFLLALAAGPANVSGAPKKMSIDTRASLIDVAARRQELQNTKSPRVLAALAKLEKCGRLDSKPGMPVLNRERANFFHPRREMDHSNKPIAGIDSPYIERDTHEQSGRDCWLVSQERNRHCGS